MDNDPIGNAAIAGAIVGGICGLLPLFLGIRNDRFILGGTGLAISAAVGVIFGLIGAVPVALIFAAFLFRRRKIA